MSRNGTVFEFVAGRGPSREILIVPLVTRPQPPLETLTRADALCDDAVSELLASGAVGDEAGQVAHTTRSGAVKRIVIVSLGDADKLRADHIRQAGVATARWLTKTGAKDAAVWLDGLLTCGIDDAVAEWAGAVALGGFRFAELREPETKKTPERIQLQLLAGESGHVNRVLPQIEAARHLSEAVNYLRRIAHQPPNILNADSLAREAKALAAKSKLRCTVLETAQLRKLGMNGLLAVGGGATPGPCLIRLDYRAAPRSRNTTVVIGKAITFDTGGYSIKPAANMEAMKFDKCGGVTVLGLLRAAAALKLKCNLTGLIAAAENAISDRAYRPADIIRMASGKTVEIISTDAEGRMVLADALWYAQAHCKPTTMIDLATLTGGVGIALGRLAAGLMSNDDNLAAELEECGRRTGERVWRLPLWDEYRDLIKGTDSDIRNSSNKREAHAIVGGMFLKEFVSDDVPWAHLDIAYSAINEDDKGLTGKGANGYGVRLLIDYLRQQT